MGVETRILNIFLHQQPVGENGLVWAGYNTTTREVSSWRESLECGGTEGSGAMQLGRITESSRALGFVLLKKLEDHPFNFLIGETRLHNEGDYAEGERGKLPQQVYEGIRNYLKSCPPRYTFVMMTVRLGGR